MGKVVVQLVILVVALLVFLEVVRALVKLVEKQLGQVECHRC